MRIALTIFVTFVTHFSVAMARAEGDPFSPLHKMRAFKMTIPEEIWQDYSGRFEYHPKTGIWTSHGDWIKGDSLEYQIGKAIEKACKSSTSKYCEIQPGLWLKKSIGYPKVIGNESGAPNLMFDMASFEIKDPIEILSGIFIKGPVQIQLNDFAIVIEARVEEVKNVSPGCGFPKTTYPETTFAYKISNVVTIKIAINKKNNERRLIGFSDLPFQSWVYNKLTNDSSAPGFYSLRKINGYPLEISISVPSLRAIGAFDRRSYPWTCDAGGN